MATPSEIASGATCFSCVPNKMDSLLYLFATIAGVADPATIAANAACYACIPNKEDALLYLADLIATNGTGGGGGSSGVVCQVGAPVAPPAGACSLSYDTATGTLYYWDGAAWVAVPVGGTGSVLCGAVPPVAAPLGSCSLYYDTVSTALYYWDGAAWILKV